ncbi:MAG TPA: RNA polymerase sigma factor [Planctomycetaceae bacterium]|nr:RNA polymerase sigma factor [Planctomycetaceae bacterium]
MADSASVTSMAALIDEHYQLVYRYAYRLCGDVVDAEDLTQQTFLTAQAKLDQLRDPAAARGWLCTIVRHAYLRERRQPQRTLSLWEGAEPWSEPSPPEDIDEAALQTALGELPEEFRTPVVLFYFEGFSYKDIAGQLQVPLGTVMSRLSRAKAHLREALSDEVDRGSVVNPKSVSFPR